MVDRSIAYAGIGATAIGTSGNRAGPAPVISEKSDKNSDKSLVTSDTTATGDNSSPDYDIQELLEAWKEYIREKVRNNVFHQYHTHSAKIQIQILISIWIIPDLNTIFFMWKGNKRWRITPTTDGEFSDRLVTQKPGYESYL